MFRGVCKPIQKVENFCEQIIFTVVKITAHLVRPHIL